MVVQSARMLFALLPFAAAAPGAAQAQGTTLEQKQRALEVITSTAERLCNVVRSEGSTQSAKVNGEISAEVNGLARRLVNLGVSSGGATEAATYQGVRQQDLASALKDVSECRQRVFDRLVGVMLWPSAPAGPPSPPDRSPPPSERAAVTPRTLQPIASPGRPGWTRDQRTGCHVWNPVPNPSETVSWSGACSDGKASGFGTVGWRWPSGSQREAGTRVAGRFEGEVTTFLDDGSRFTGPVVNESRVPGPATLVLASGVQVKGNFAGHPTPFNISGDAVVTGSNFLYQGPVDADYRPHGFGAIRSGAESPYWAAWTNGCALVNGLVTAVMRPLSDCERRR